MGWQAGAECGVAEAGGERCTGHRYAPNDACHTRACCDRCLICGWLDGRGGGRGRDGAAAGAELVATQHAAQPSRRQQPTRRRESPSDCRWLFKQQASCRLLTRRFAAGGGGFHAGDQLRLQGHRRAALRAGGGRGRAAGGLHLAAVPVGGPASGEPGVAAERLGGRGERRGGGRVAARRGRRNVVCSR